MIDTLAETLISLRDGNRLPTKPTQSTMYRWANIGFNGVKLETVYIGGSRMTSIEAYERFIHRLNGGRVATDGTSTGAFPETPDPGGADSARLETKPT